MNLSPTGSKSSHPSAYLKAAGLVLAVSLGALSAAAQQNQGDQPQPPAQQQENQGQGQPDFQNQPQQALPLPPETLTLPAGTVVRVRVDEWLSSNRNLVGDNFSATLDQPIVVAGWVVARRGQAQSGLVSLVKKAGHAGGTSQLGVEFPELTVVDGQQLPINTELLQTSAGTSHGQDAAIVGGTTGTGAVIGAIADGGPGAAIGAGIGVAAGIIGVMATRGRPAEISPETVLTFRLQSPVTISTVNSQFAFLPVTQADYGRSAQNRSRLRRPGPPPPYYPYPPYPYAYGYPYGYYPPYWFGVYGRFGRY